MASANIIDTDKLTAPISEESPVGINLRDDPSADSLYRKTKQARKDARGGERSGLSAGSYRDGSPDANDARANEKTITDNWNLVRSLAPTILLEHSKDLEVCSWYIEALIRQRENNFANLAQGFKLIRLLIEKYWDTIYPLPDELDGLMARVAPLAGLNGEGRQGVLIAPIRNIPITDKPAYSYAQYQYALDFNKKSQDDRKKSRDPGYSLDDIEQLVNKSDGTFYIKLRDDISQCLTEFKLMNDLLGEHCGVQIAPASSNIRTALEQSLGAVNHLAKDKFPVEEIATAEGETAAGDDAAATNTSAKAAVSSREAAFQQLNVISDFFLKTEPHSPIAYVLAKAVKWGNMPLNELIAELIPNGDARKHFFTLTGVKEENSDNGN